MEMRLLLLIQCQEEHETLKEGRATKRSRKNGSYQDKGASLKHIKVMRAMYPSVQRTCWRRSTESRVYSLRAFVSLFAIVELPAFCFVGLHVVVMDKVVHSFEDCHHCHDKRSTETKTKLLQCTNMLLLL